MKNIVKYYVNKLKFPLETYFPIILSAPIILWLNLPTLFNFHFIKKKIVRYII